MKSNKKEYKIRNTYNKKEQNITYILRYIINAYKIRVQFKSSYILIYIRS